MTSAAPLPEDGLSQGLSIRQIQVKTLGRLAREIASLVDPAYPATWGDMLDKISSAPALSAIQKDWLNARLKGTRAEVQIGDYVGPRFPHAVIVGDEPGTRLPSYGAFTPWPCGCGEHLLTAMQDVHLSLKTFGLVNSLHTDLPRLYVALGGPRMIAAGRRAHERLHNWSVPVSGYVYHPQYELRFRHAAHHRLTYGRLIEECATSFSRTRI